MTARQQDDIVQPLLELGAMLQIGAADWLPCERVAEIRCLGHPVSRDAVASLDCERVRSIMAFYAGALTATISFVDDLQLTASLDEAERNRFLTAAVGNPTFSLDMTLDKTRLIALRWGEKRGCRLFLFLFHEVMEAFLKEDLGQIEQVFFFDEQRRKTILILPDQAVFLDGPHLALIGGVGLYAWNTIQPASPTEAERALRIYRTCRRQLNWQQEWVESITPFHLALEYPEKPVQLEQSAPSNVTIVDILHTHFTNLAILFTAQSSERRGDKLFSTYSSASRAIDIPLRPASDPLTEDERKGIGDLLRVVSWTYEEHHASSRFAFIQDSLVRELLPIAEPCRYSTVLRSSSDLIRQLEWRWEFFVKDQVDIYLTQVRDLENDVDKAVQAFADQLATLTKSLTDTMLGAVVAIVTALVASVIKEKFNPLLFTIGILAYAVYVHVFHLWYSLTTVIASRRWRWSGPGARRGP